MTRAAAQVIPAALVHAFDHLDHAVPAALGADVPDEQTRAERPDGGRQHPLPPRRVHQDAVEAGLGLVERAVEGREDEERVVKDEPERARDAQRAQPLRLEQRDVQLAAIAELLDAEGEDDEDARCGEELEMPVRGEETLLEVGAPRLSGREEQCAAQLAGAEEKDLDESDAVREETRGDAGVDADHAGHGDHDRVLPGSLVPGRLRHCHPHASARPLPKMQVLCSAKHSAPGASIAGERIGRYSFR
jgi:hypothetical protein